MIVHLVRVVRFDFLYVKFQSIFEDFLAGEDVDGLVNLEMTLAEVLIAFLPNMIHDHFEISVYGVSQHPSPRSQAMYAINNAGYVVDLQWLYDSEVCLLKIDVSYGSQVNGQQCDPEQLLKENSR